MKTMNSPRSKTHHGQTTTNIKETAHLHADKPAEWLLGECRMSRSQPEHWLHEGRFDHHKFSSHHHDHAFKTDHHSPKSKGQALQVCSAWVYPEEHQELDLQRPDAWMGGSSPNQLSPRRINRPKPIALPKDGVTSLPF